MIVPAPAGAAPWAEQPFVPLGPDVGADCLAATGADRVTHVREIEGEWDAARLLRVAPDGALVPDGSVALAPMLECPTVATSASGAAVAAAPPFAPGRRGLVVATRDPGGEFGAPQAILAPRTTGVGEIHAAVAADGAAVVVWNETRARGDRTISRLLASRRPPGGAFGPAQTLLSGAADAPSPVAGIDDAGRATVAWLRPLPSGSSAVDVAGAAAGAPFGPPQTVTRTVDFAVPPVLAVAPDGGALLAHDGSRGVRVFERPPGATAMSRVPLGATDSDDEYPAVALASGGAAMVAWRRDALDERKARLVAARRAPGAAFAAPQDVGAGVPRGDPARPSFTPVEDFEAIAAAAAADGSAHVAWLEAPRLPGGDEPARVAVASAAAGGDWSEAARLGGPGRSASAPAALAAPAAVAWTDNIVADAWLFDVAPAGRVHVALQGVAAPPPPPAPGLTLRAARRQSVRYRDPVVVTARCAAACDLRAVGGREPATRGPRVAATGQRGDAGDVRLALLPEDSNSASPPGGRPLRVTVRATAPGGADVRVARVDLDVDNVFVPPPRRPVGVAIERRGGRLVVRWRTRRPAHSEEFLVMARRSRDGEILDSASRDGDGRTRFRVVLAARGARVVEFLWLSTEPRLGSGSRAIPVP